MGILDTVGINGTDYEVADSAARSMIAPAYDSSKTYAAGDYVTYSGGLFRCATPITTAEAWTAAHWDSVNVGAEVSGLRFSEAIDTAKAVGFQGAYVDSNQILKSGGVGKIALIQTTGAGVYKLIKTVGTVFRHGYSKADNATGSQVYNWVNDDNKTVAFMDIPSDATYIIIQVVTSGDATAALASLSIDKFTHAYDAEAAEAISAMRDITSLPTDSGSLIQQYGSVNDPTVFVGGIYKSFYFACRSNARYVIDKTDTSATIMMGAWLKEAPANGISYYGKRTNPSAKRLIIETGSDAAYVYFTVGDNASDFDTLRASITIMEYSKAVDYKAREEIAQIQDEHANQVHTLPRDNFLQTVDYDHEFFYESMYFPPINHMSVGLGVASNTNQKRATGIYFDPTGAHGNSNDYSYTLYNAYGFVKDNARYKNSVTRALNLANCSALVLGDSTIDQSDGGVVKHMSDIFTAAEKTLTLLGTLDTATYPNEGRAGWALKDYVGQTTRGRNEEAGATYTNPFWNATAEKFDFSYYMSEQGYSGVDYVVIQLGINDLGGVDMADPYAYIQTMYGWLCEIIDSVLDYNSSIKIILDLPTTVNADDTKIAQTSEIRFVQLARIALYNSYVIDQSLKDYAWTSVRPSYCHLVLDPDTDFNDSVHPNSGGYLKMAKEVVNQMNHFMNE